MSREFQSAFDALFGDAEEGQSNVVPLPVREVPCAAPRSSDDDKSEQVSGGGAGAVSTETDEVPPSSD